MLNKEIIRLYLYIINIKKLDSKYLDFIFI